MLYLLELGFIGLCIAVLPLGWVLLRRDANKYRKLAWVTTFLTLDLIMFGGFTRLTDSGLGCPDWPGCYGTSSPFAAHADIHAAQALLPTGPVTFVKAWIEMIHRYFAMSVGVLIIALMVVAWARRRELKQSPWLATWLFILVCVQGAFGAWTVTMKLQPVIVTTHLMLALTLLGSLVWLASRQMPLASVAADPGALRWRWAALIGLALLVFQIALGGWVSTNYAVLACTDFPTCQGQWVPPMDFHNGFKLWRELGKTAGGEVIPMAALVAIHWVHRTFAVVVVLYLAWLASRLRRHAALRRASTLLLALVFVQFATGLSNIVFQWPLLNAVAHNGGAAVLLLLLVMLNYRIRAARTASIAAGLNDQADLSARQKPLPAAEPAAASLAGAPTGSA
ncbi:COX15/CtaA family protein [Pandoraea nosoerga]|uniref:Cytochrome C oxidase subunit I n=1 Tax=Pandoraea nosoerga TaxID=2508296 RepID=A0A5E4RPR3_9BURK|nr:MULTISPECIES: COX15/CtaA family protein [Pandoraea]MBN4664581.1 COX15/CtaA family protein [Pandoraea nosoerga]MBN4674383.1 COX15/CtaA family protein [Pandoraea nosoerga]MBN4679651.1 COX15/CtaA family protein [Pandoraea nosoerga]MBN4743260.1 COX15/CtaA family protein [Pandoraea nosoerga]VVD65390.1 cytochrome C oxidase subunit I [Pandoraea nosoerga]